MTRVNGDRAGWPRQSADPCRADGRMARLSP
jgi:hypothetical protein